MTFVSALVESLKVDVLPLLAEVVGVALLALLTAAVAAFKAKVKNEYAQKVIARLRDVVRTVVLEQKQTIVDGLKAANEDGKLTKEEIADIQAAAVRKIKSHLGVKGLRELAYVLGFSTDSVEVNTVIKSEVEAAVVESKQLPF